MQNPVVKLGGKKPTSREKDILKDRKCCKIVKKKKKAYYYIKVRPQIITRCDAVSHHCGGPCPMPSDVTVIFSVVERIGL